MFSLGLIALAFVGMGFRLLTSEQRREKGVREAMIILIERFNGTCIVLAVICVILGVFELVVLPKMPRAQCRDSLLRMKTLAEDPSQDADSLRKLIENTMQQCVEKEDPE